MKTFSGVMLRQHIIVLIIAIFPLAEPAEEIITPPANAAQILGGTAQFKCQVNLDKEPKMQWSFNNLIIYNYQSGEEDYPKRPNQGYYAVKRDAFFFTLSINNLRYEDGGNYTCSIVKNQKSAVLVVIGEPALVPPPSIPVEGETSNYTCRACFSGPYQDKIAKENFPQLTVSVENSEQLPLSNPTKVTREDDRYCLVKVLPLTVDASMHGEKMTCEIATEKPAMKVINSTDIFVHYPVRNITYIPNKDKYDVGSSISCTADGNPPPSIVWKKLEGKAITSTRLNITEDLIGHTFWRCTATNTIQGEVYEVNITVMVNAVLDIADTGEQNDNTNAGTYASAIIITLLVIFVIVIGLSMAWRCKQKRPYKLLSQSINKYEDLEKNGNTIVKMLPREGKKILERDPKIFLEMTKSASTLIKSDHYTKVMKIMADIYKDEAISKKLKEGPLDCLIQMMDEKEQLQVLVENQEKTLSLIQMLIEAEDAHSNPECIQKVVKADLSDSESVQMTKEADDHSRSKNQLLLYLITNSEYCSYSKHTFKWTEELFSTLKLLLEKGADPTWIMEGSDPKKTDLSLTAMYHFCSVTCRLLLENNYVDQIQDVMLSFMKYISPTTEYHKNTPLHALAQFDWKVLNQHLEKKGQLPIHLFEHYKTNIDAMKNKIPGICDTEDSRGRTPMQLFLEKITVHEEILKDVIDIVECLKSKTNIENPGKDGRNVMHFLADAYPVLYQGSPEKVQETHASDDRPKVNLDEDEKTENEHSCQKDKERCKELLSKLFRTLETEKNVGMQDYGGQTALHILAMKLNRVILDEHHEIFRELVKIFVSTEYNKVSADHEGNTVLHILASQVYEEPELGKGLLPVFEMLTTAQNVNARNMQCNTPYNWIMQGLLRNHKVQSDATVFYKIQEIFKKYGTVYNELPPIQNHEETNEKEKTQTEKQQSSLATSEETTVEKLKRLDEYIRLPKRQEYIRAYQKDLRHYLMLDEEFLDDLKDEQVITPKEKKLIQGGPNKSEDERITDMITIMWNVEDNEKYLKLLEAFAEEYDELVDLLTGGNWRRKTFS